MALVKDHGAVMKNAWRAIGLITLAAGSLLFLTGAKAAGTDPRKPNGNKPKGTGYQGPGPNTPRGGRNRGRPSATPPVDLAADDLWISPDCLSVIVGSRWLEETALAAVREWIADGKDSARTYDDSFVVRQVVGPYSPLCVDVRPWPDIADPKMTGEEFYARAQQFENAYPQLDDLIENVYRLYHAQMEPEMFYRDTDGGPNSPQA